MDKSIQVLQHNLGVVARRLNVVTELTTERLNKACDLATKHGLFHGNRGTAFALVALNVISGKLGGRLQPRALNVVLRSLAYAHDHCVLGDKDPIEVTQVAIRNLCKVNRIFGADQVPLVLEAIPIVEIVREYKHARESERETLSVKSTGMAHAILAQARKRANTFVPGIDDDEDDLIKLGYM